MAPLPFADGGGGGGGACTLGAGGGGGGGGVGGDTEGAFAFFSRTTSFSFSFTFSFFSLSLRGVGGDTFSLRGVLFPLLPRLSLRGASSGIGGADGGGEGDDPLRFSFRSFSLRGVCADFFSLRGVSLPSLCLRGVGVVLRFFLGEGGLPSCRLRGDVVGGSLNRSGGGVSVDLFFLWRTGA